MATLDEVNQKIISGITGSVNKSSFINGIGWLLLGMIVIGVAGWVTWTIIERKKYNKIIEANGIMHGFFHPVYADVAKSIKLGKGGFEVLYLKKLKTWKLAHGARTGVNKYTFYILPDGYWYPGQVSANIYTINKMNGLLPVITTNPTMRSQYTSLEKQIDALHGDKKGFWDKYGNWILSIGFVLIIGVLAWLCFREVGQFLGKGTALADTMNQLAETMNRLAVNLNNGQPSGLVPAA